MNTPWEVGVNSDHHFDDHALDIDPVLSIQDDELDLAQWADDDDLHLDLDELGFADDLQTDLDRYVDLADHDLDANFARPDHSVQ